jgi:hypothetical protein
MKMLVCIPLEIWRRSQLDNSSPYLDMPPGSAVNTSLTTFFVNEKDSSAKFAGTQTKYVL